MSVVESLSETDVLLDKAAQMSLGTGYRQRQKSRAAELRPGELIQVTVCTQGTECGDRDDPGSVARQNLETPSSLFGELKTTRPSAPAPPPFHEVHSSTKMVEVSAGPSNSVGGTNKMSKAAIAKRKHDAAELEDEQVQGGLLLPKAPKVRKAAHAAEDASSKHRTPQSRLGAMVGVFRKKSASQRE
jgi:hypothetical protein